MNPSPESQHILYLKFYMAEEIASGWMMQNITVDLDRNLPH